MWLFLEALDVWLFRDGRPFDAGSEHRAESLFPPYPSVMQGAIRSHHLVLRGVDLGNQDAIRAEVGTADDLRALRLRGPFLARREGNTIRRYLPQPADAVSIKDERRQVQRASPPTQPAAGVVTSAPTTQLLGLRDDPVKGEGGLWLGEDVLGTYLSDTSADRPAVSGVPSSTLFARESRFGIGIEPGNRVTREGALYEAEFIRPTTCVGLLVEIEGYDGWPKNGVLRIGGEGRAARFQQVNVNAASGQAPAPVASQGQGERAERLTTDPWPAPPDPLPEQFRVYFATPAYFSGGWQPAQGAWSRFFEGEVELMAAAVSRYESIGGYELAENRHKPSRRYVPAGSVYYFRGRRGARLRPGLPHGALTESTRNDFEAKAGFGQFLVGGW